MQLLDLILYKAYAELKRDTAQAYLGMLWWLLEPLMYLAAFYTVFALGFRVGGDNFVSFLLCGLVAWKWFASTLNQAAASIISHKGLIQQIYLPKYLLPLIPIVVNFAKFLIVFMLLLVFLALSGHEIGWAWCYVLPIVAIELLFIVSVSFLAAALVPFVMDLRILISNGLIMLMFLSGIFFNVNDFEPEVAHYFYFNPLVVIIESLRTVLLQGLAPNWGLLIYVVLLSLCLLVPAVYLLKRFDRYYPKVVL